MRLGNVDDGTRHASNEDNASRALALHQVTSDRGSKEVGAVNVDGPKLANAVNGIFDGLKVLGETSRGDKVVDLAVGLDDFCDTGLDGVLIANIGVVSGDLGDAGDF